MRAAESFPHIFLHRQPVDGRKQINGLSQIAMQMDSGAVRAAALFVFTNKSRDVVRCLYWDRTGFAMWVKRLEKDRFRWPRRLEGELILLSQKELCWLLDGIDICKSRPHQVLSCREM